MAETTFRENPTDGAFDPYEIPTDPAERRARREQAMRESHENLLEALRECDAAMHEFANRKKTLFERIFGFHTSV